jgi:glutamine synthetase
VLSNQWEYQLFCQEGALKTAHYLWLSRYLLLRVSEFHGVNCTFHPKPFRFGNGAGCHHNFSTKAIRESANPKATMQPYIDKLSKTHDVDVKVMGQDNDKRLTGTNETSCLDTFSSGVGNRAVSIRIPNEGAYLEDRRPAANCDPYLTVIYLMRAACYVETGSPQETLLLPIFNSI